MIPKKYLDLKQPGKAPLREIERRAGSYIIGGEVCSTFNNSDLTRHNDPLSHKGPPRILIVPISSGLKALAEVKGLFGGFRT